MFGYFIWSYLTFVLRAACFHLFWTCCVFCSSYQIRRYSRQLVSSSLPPCHWWFFRYLTLFFSHIFLFFFRLKTLIGCLSIPFAIAVLSSYHFLLYPFRLEDTIKHSRCRHAINLHMIQSLFFSCLLCFQFSCPFLFFSSTWPFLATIEDWIGPYWNCLLQPRSSTECELRDYHFI